MIDFNKPVMTRMGRPVRILCTDSNNPDYPIVGLIADSEGREYPYSWSLDGFLIKDQFNAEDIINVEGANR